MTVTAHELARELLTLPDLPVVISTDISTCDEDSYNRAFGHEYLGVNDDSGGSTGEIVLLFFGNLNY